MTTWGELKRSDTPIPWKRMLERLTFTPEELVTAINKGQLLSTIIDRTDEVMKMTNEQKPQDEAVDMDEASKQIQESAEEVDSTEDDVLDDDDSLDEDDEDEEDSDDSTEESEDDSEV